MQAIPAFLLALTLVSGPATDAVKEKLSAVIVLLKNPGDGTEARAIELIDGLLNYSAFDRATLGGEWENRTEDEKSRFSPLLKNVLRRAFLRNLKKTADCSLEFGEENTAGGVVTVSVKAAFPKDSKEDPIRIQYRMKEAGGTWRAQDIVTEDVSLVSSYRSQFVKIIQKDGFEELLKKMKSKLDRDDR